MRPTMTAVFASNGSRRPRCSTVGTDAPVPSRTLLLVLAVLVFAFAGLYPYLDATEACGDPGCPQFVQSHTPVSVELPAGTLGAPLATAALALARRVIHRFASDREPAQVYLSPDPDPPRL